MNVSFPVDFERRDGARLLVMKLQARSIGKAEALLACYRLWFDWFTAGVELRPLKRGCQSREDHDWGHEDLAYVLTEASGLKLTPQEFMPIAIQAGFILLSEDGAALQLQSFWRFNEHCSPDFKTIQQKGGEARQAVRKLAEADMEADARRKILESQGALQFGLIETTEEERTRSISLIMRMDRAIGNGVRMNLEFVRDSLQRDALNVVRSYTASEILAVETFLVANRSNPEVVKNTEKIIINFSEYVRKSQA